LRLKQPTTFVPVWIDIRPKHGLETARPGRRSRWRG
jgi:hypothetical protein